MVGNASSCKLQYATLMLPIKTTITMYIPVGFHEAIFPAHEKWERIFVWVSDADFAVLYSFHDSKTRDVLSRQGDINPAYIDVLQQKMAVAFSTLQATAQSYTISLVVLFSSYFHCTLSLNFSPFSLLIGIKVQNEQVVLSQCEHGVIERVKLL